MDILQAISDPNLFRSYLGDNLNTWRPWLTALSVLYGLGGPRDKAQRQLITDCTGRNPSKLPKDGFSTALFLTGRRSGKSRIAAVVGAYEACLAGHAEKLSKGEKGVVCIASPTKSQSRIVRDYLRSIFETPLLAGEVVNETQSGFELRNNIRIEILSGDWKTIRGYTLVATIVDEVCFFGTDSESKVKNDAELIQAIKPGLASIGGRLVCISSPYARLGWSYAQYKRCYANDKARTLIWNCSSRTMNSTLPQSVIDEAMQEDLQAAKSEYGGEWRDDICLFLSHDLIQSVVIPDRTEILPRNETRYVAFSDVSGGRSDGSALSVGHVKDGKVLVDACFHWPSPHDPNRVIACQAEELRRYRVKKVVGDAYAAEFVSKAFEQQGIRYEKSPKPASQCYLELLPRITSQQVELLDVPLLINQLASLERRTRSGGKDTVDHPRGSHDDLANSVAGLVTIAAHSRRYAGALRQENMRWQTFQKTI